MLRFFILFWIQCNAVSQPELNERLNAIWRVEARLVFHLSLVLDCLALGEHSIRCSWVQTRPIAQLLESFEERYEFLTIEN